MAIPGGEHRFEVTASQGRPVSVYRPMAVVALVSGLIALLVSPWHGWATVALGVVLFLILGLLRLAFGIIVGWVRFKKESDARVNSLPRPDE